MAKDLTKALQDLTEQAQGQTSRVDKALPATREAPAIPARSGASGRIAYGGSGGGIASPLVETSYAARTWHANTSVLSSDGLFSLVIKPVKTINFQDANHNDVQIEFKAPA